MRPKIPAGIGLAALGLLAGCSSIPPGAERGPDGTMAYNVLIEASEPGATIKANGEDIGKTPVTLKIFGDADGTFHDFGSYFYIIEAFPLQTNQFYQVRQFRTGHLLTPEDYIPRHIFFDMNHPQPSYPPPAAYYYYGSPYPYWGPEFYVGPRFYFGPRYHRHW